MPQESGSIRQPGPDDYHGSPINVHRPRSPSRDGPSTTRGRIWCLAREGAGVATGSRRVPGTDRPPYDSAALRTSYPFPRLPIFPRMSLTLRLLGTAASRPTVERNVSSVVIEREGETLMFDCGEGTQRQMMRYGVSFTFGDVFFSHFHADHLLGIIGLVRTMALQGRTELLRMWGP
jgi:hypothetical protein